MQTGYTGYVDRSEWWWTTIVSLTFILVTFSPFIIITLFNPIQTNIQFMGAIHDHVDAASQIARMEQGANGEILLDFLYSPQEQAPALVHPLYALLGQLVHFSQLSSMIMFHIMRIFISLFMFLTIYHLGASIWVKIRTRRIFFILASVGAGFGWLFALLTGNASAPDLILPQAFPLYASAANIHYPLAIACVALIASVIVSILRPGEDETPSAENKGSIVFLASLVLAFVYPDALIPLGIAYTLNVIANWYIQRKASNHEWYWGLWILVPALPVITYDLLIVVNNPFVASWLSQRGTNTPSILMLLMSLGLPLILAIPGLIRALRRFEPDGDRFMLFWLLAMVITMYLPLQLNQYLLLGLMIPVAYFATRAIEDFWLKPVRRIYRPRVYMAIFPLLILSHIIWMFLPVFPLIDGWNGYSTFVLEQEYGNTLIWLDRNVDTENIILASEDVSLWIPAWTGQSVVYGHPAETYNAEETKNEVLDWYQQDDAGAENCLSLIYEYQITYVLYGPREQRIGPATCGENLTVVEQIGSLTIFATEYAER